MSAVIPRSAQKASISAVPRRPPVPDEVSFFRPAGRVVNYNISGTMDPFASPGKDGSARFRGIGR